MSATDGLMRGMEVVAPQAPEQEVKTREESMILHCKSILILPSISPFEG